MAETSKSSNRHNFEQLLNQGRELTTDGNYKKAVDYYLQIYSDKFTSEIKLSPKKEMTLLNELGLSMRMFQNYTLAESAFTKALATAKRENDQENQLLALVGLIDIYRTGERHKKDVYQSYFGKSLPIAYGYMRQAIEIINQVENPSFAQVKALTEFGLLDMEQVIFTTVVGKKKLYIKALQSYNLAEEQLNLLEHNDYSHSNLRLRSRIYHVRGVVFEKLGLNDKAYKDQLEAFQRYNILGDKRGIGITAMALGNLALLRNDRNNARSWFKTALAAASSGLENDEPIASLASNALMALGPHPDKETA